MEEKFKNFEELDSYYCSLFEQLSSYKAFVSVKFYKSVEDNICKQYILAFKSMQYNFKFECKNEIKYKKRMRKVVNLERKRYFVVEDKNIQEMKKALSVLVNGSKPKVRKKTLFAFFQRRASKND